MRKHFPRLSLDVPRTLSAVLELRRIFLSGQLSEVCRETENPRILSVANGSLREAETALDLCRLARGKFVVLDGTGEPPDLLKLDAKHRFARYISYPHGVIPSKDNIGDFDYVYVLNLLSEVDQQRARGMVGSLISLVRPGGRLLVCNFTSEFADLGLGGFHRREEEMADLVPDSGAHRILGHAIWRDESRGILYLEIQKFGSVSRDSPSRSRFLH